MFPLFSSGQRHKDKRCTQPNVQRFSVEPLRPRLTEENEEGAEAGRPCAGKMLTLLLFAVFQVRFSKAQTCHELVISAQ